MGLRATRRRVLRGAAGLAGTATLAGCLARGETDLTSLEQWPPERGDDELSFWTWQEYWGNQARAFEHVDDLDTVRQTNLPSADQFDRLNDGADVDVLHVEPRHFGRALENNLLQPIPAEQLPAWSGGEDLHAHDDYYRRDGEYYGFPQTPMYQGLAYHTEFVDQPDSWSILWDDKFAGRIAMPADPVLAGQIAALYTGQDPHDPDDVDDVEAALEQQRPLIHSYWTDWMNSWRRFGAGELVASVLPSPRMCLCSQDGTPIRRAQPDEGVLYGWSTLAVPQSAANPWTALRFINWAVSYKTGGSLVWKPEEWTLYHDRPLEESVETAYREIADRAGVGEN